MINKKPMGLWCSADRTAIQGSPEKRTPEKQYGCPLFWTTLYMQDDL